MAENEQAVDVGTQEQVQAAPEPVVQQAESAAPAEGQQSAPAEKMVPSSQVSKIAAREARAAAEKARAETSSQYEQRIAELEQQQQQAHSVGGMQQQSPEMIRQLIQQEAWNMSRQAQAKQIEDNWVSSMRSEMVADPDFADLYEALNIEQQPNIVLAMAGMDNKAAMVKDLAKNPSKYANILMLANGGSPKLAQMELAKLSASIRTNEEALKQPKVDAPLSQIKPSNISGDDGNLSVTDFRKIFRG